MMAVNMNNTNAKYLENLSIASLTPMQEEVIAKLQQVTNLILVAPTGSGKTVAFLIPLINRLVPGKKNVQAFIIAPSRELAIQIEQVFRNMKTSYKVSCFYGGHSMQIERNSMSEAPAVIIGTPGRIADHIRRGTVDASVVEMVVLDEFDKSLQMGFHKELREIFDSLNGKQNHILTSATNLKDLPDFLPFREAETLTYFANEVKSRLEQKIITCSSSEKLDTLFRLIAGFGNEVCLVFCNHREAVDRISSHFNEQKYEHSVFHGGMDQIEREKSLIRFRGGATNVLVATDLAARGLDIPEIRHVVHYQLPPDRDSFIHRNGRTARMHAEGKSYVIIADDDVKPEYIDGKTEKINFSGKPQRPKSPVYECLYVSAGKKDKISKGDIAGLLIKKGGVSMDEIGLITVLDHSCYVSVKRNVSDAIVNRITGEKIKKTKIRVEIAN